MEKLYVGWQMSTRWTDPTLVLFMLLPISIGWIWGTGYCLYCECYRMYLPVPSVIVYIIFQLWMWDTEEVNTKKYIVFHIKSFRSKIWQQTLSNVKSLWMTLLIQKLVSIRKWRKAIVGKYCNSTDNTLFPTKLDSDKSNGYYPSLFHQCRFNYGLGYGNSSVKDMKHTKKRNC